MSAKPDEANHILYFCFKKHSGAEWMCRPRFNRAWVFPAGFYRRWTTLKLWQGSWIGGCFTSHRCGMADNQAPRQKIEEMPSSAVYPWKDSRPSNCHFLCSGLLPLRRVFTIVTALIASV